MSPEYSLQLPSSSTHVSLTHATSTRSPSWPLDVRRQQEDKYSGSREGSRPSRKSSSQGHAIAELSNAILQFGVNLYRALRSGSATAASDTLPVHDHLENVLLSPYLIASMMQPMAAGARGETAAQIFRLVQCPEVWESAQGCTETGKARRTPSCVFCYRITRPVPLLAYQRTFPCCVDQVVRYFAYRDKRLLPDGRRNYYQQAGFTTQYDCCLHRDRRVALKEDFEARHLRRLREDSAPSSSQSGGAGSGGTYRRLRKRPRCGRLRSQSHDFVNDSVHQRWKIETELKDAVPLLGKGTACEALPRGSVDEHTSLVLLSAVAVKGRWRRRFHPAQVNEGIFYEPSSDGATGGVQQTASWTPRAVIMMHQTGNFRMADSAELEATALELPYKSGARYLVVFLPQRQDGLDALEARMTADNLAQCLRQMKRRMDVDLTLPKFHVRAATDLAAALSSMGADLLFDRDAADLSGMCASEGAFVSVARHAAAFRTSWKGRVSRSPALTPSVQHEKFTVNRPFLFLVLSRRPNAVLLLGSVRSVRPHFCPELLPSA
ncbi:ipis-1-like [Dermacentor andersoni]|uniref:ipis-1-like n=1 Tax=Dermacentor andersoni TaxID=34620 RepID=UPI003B3AD62B